MQELKINYLYIIKSIIKSILGFVIAIVVFTIIFSVGGDRAIINALIYLFFGGGFAVLGFFMLILRVLTFSYSLGEDFIIVKQGVINRSEKHLPYVVIQDIIVRQDLLDRIFGLTTVIIENASMGGMMVGGNSKSAYAKGNQALLDTPGMYSNKLVIPGFMKGEAVKMRDYVLGKIKAGGAKGSEL